MKTSVREGKTKQRSKIKGTGRGKFPEQQKERVEDGL